MSNIMIQVFFHTLVIIGSTVITCSRGEDSTCSNEQNKYVFSIPLVVYPQRPPHVLMTTSSLAPIFTTLTIPGFGYEVTNIISKHSPVDIRLSADDVGIDIRLHRFDQKQNKTIVVETSGEISLFVMDNELSQGDGLCALPISQLGTQYYPPTEYKSFFTISAVCSDTSISISTLTGQTRQIFLKQYESYRYDGEAYENLKGRLHVESNKPIALVSGAFEFIPEGASTHDGLLEQIPPVRNWGYSYVITPFLSLISGYLYRVFTTIHTATLHMSDGNIIRIAAESVHEGDVTGDTVVSFISDTPVMVVQYTKGELHFDDKSDPSMLIITPISSFSADVTFPVYQYTIYRQTTCINVIINCEYLNGVHLDDTPLMSSDTLHTSDNSMCCLRSEVSIGYHTISHTNPMARFSVIIYSFGGHHQHFYAYAANAFSAVESFSNQPQTQTPKNMTTPLTLTSKEGCYPLKTIDSDTGDVVPAKDVYLHGYIITVYCRQGYKLIGDEQLVCSITGSWVGEIPRCSIDDRNEQKEKLKKKEYRQLTSQPWHKIQIIK